jgi:hypothetical protein
VHTHTELRTHDIMALGIKKKMITTTITASNMCPWFEREARGSTCKTTRVVGTKEYRANMINGPV